MLIAATDRNVDARPLFDETPSKKREPRAQHAELVRQWADYGRFARG
jgi:hypothetical protein